MFEAVEKWRQNANAFNFRFFPALIGQPNGRGGLFMASFSFRGRYYAPQYQPPKPLSWGLSKDISGGGALFDRVAGVD